MKYNFVCLNKINEYYFLTKNILYLPYSMKNLIQIYSKDNSLIMKPFIFYVCLFVVSVLEAFLLCVIKCIYKKA